MSSPTFARRKLFFHTMFLRFLRNIIYERAPKGSSLYYVKTSYSVEIHEQLIKKFPGQPNGSVQVGPDKFVLICIADIIYNFEARHDDIFLCTHPRSGTTWTQETVWLICHDLDYETERFPYLESHLWANETNLKPWRLRNVNVKEYTDTKYNEFAKLISRHLLNTHFPIKMLPRNTHKVGAKIYVAPNPKDVAVSYYHLNRAHPFLAFNGDFETFAELFMDNLSKLNTEVPTLVGRNGQLPYLDDPRCGVAPPGILDFKDSCKLKMVEISS